VRGLLARLASYWRGLRHSSQLDADMETEMRFHIDMEAQRLMRQHGLDAHEARRQAGIAFGGIEKYRGASHDALGFTWARGVSVDLKLAVRMLVKYRGLTLAGGLALAIAIGIGAGWYDLTGDLLRPVLPLPEGDRIVEIEMRNSLASEDERRVLHDFLAWRRNVRSIEDLGAYRTLERNLILGDARPEPVTVAETTASAFRLVRVPPLVGRPLLDADEEPGAPPVVVLGYQVWQRRFGRRPDAIGRTIQLGRVTTTVVGVMPEGFAFPVNHGLWVPLQLRPSGYAPLEGPAIRVFGAGHHSDAGTRGGVSTNRTRGGSLPPDSRASAPARPGVRRRVSG
jgi:putative ABC transport system permease protein